MQVSHAKHDLVLTKPTAQTCSYITLVPQHDHPSTPEPTISPKQHLAQGLAYKLVFVRASSLASVLGSTLLGTRRCGGLYADGSPLLQLSSSSSSLMICFRGLVF